MQVGEASHRATFRDGVSVSGERQASVLVRALARALEEA